MVQKEGKAYAEVLGIDLGKGEREIFKWFLASLLFGRRIGEGIAMRTYKEFEKEGLVTPRAIQRAGWGRLVKVLDGGGYVRYDFSTATRLLEITKKLLEGYGSLTKLHEAAGDAKDLERRLQEFREIGPVTTNIFLRELRVVWRKADPEPGPLAVLAARRLRVDLKVSRKTKRFIRLEAWLTRMGKRFRKDAGRA